VTGESAAWPDTGADVVMDSGASAGTCAAAGADTGIFLTVEDLSLLFSSLKKNEAHLNLRERQVLNRIERLLYKNLSIEEIENRLRGSVGYG